MNYPFVNHFHRVRGQETSSIIANLTLIFTVCLRVPTLIITWKYFQFQIERI